MKLRLHHREWTQKNIEAVRAKRRAWKVRKREERLAWQRQYLKRRYHENIVASRAKGRAAAKRWRVRNPELSRARGRASTAKWKQQDPEGYRVSKCVWEAVRRARVRGATVGKVDFERIQRRDRMRCHICKTKVDRADLHFDHVIPLVAGGEHTEANIAVAHAKCNLRKNAKVLTLF